MGATKGNIVINEFSEAEDFAKNYYQLEKSNINTVTIKSAIRFAERYHQHQLKKL